MKHFIKLSFVAAIFFSFSAQAAIGPAKKIGFLSKSEEVIFAEQANRNEITLPEDVLSGVFRASRLQGQNGISIIDTIFSDKNTLSAVILGKNGNVGSTLKIELSGMTSSTINKIERIVQNSFWITSRDRVSKFGGQLTQMIYSRHSYTLKINLTKPGQSLDEDQAKEVSNIINEIVKATMDDRVQPTETEIVDQESKPESKLESKS